MHQGQRLAVVVHHVLQGLAHQALGALAGHRLDANATVLVETDLGDAHFLLEELDHLVRLWRTGFPFDTRVDVLGVLTENHHVDVAGLLHRARHTLEPQHRTQAHIQVELLAQCNVERANAATDRRGQRPFDRHHIVAHGIEGLLGQPGILVIHLGGLLAGIHFHPGNLALAAIGLVDGGIDHLDHHRRHIDADTIALDIGNDGVVGHIERMVRIDGDLGAVGRNLDFLVSHACTTPLSGVIGHHAIPLSLNHICRPASAATSRHIAATSLVL
ncbi:hypothetical protein D3C79_644300 [compost metagenome]